MVKRAQRGVTYLALLFAVAATSAALATTATVLSRTLQRERETQLLWAGGQIRHAIAAYSQHAGDEGSRYPRTLQDLLLDPRSAAPRRFLRRIYDDPMTGSTDWALIRDAQGRIVGVHSRSMKAPLKRAGFGAGQQGFERARRHADWRFSAVAEYRLPDPPALAAPAAATTPPDFPAARATPAPASQDTSLPAEPPTRADTDETRDDE